MTIIVAGGVLLAMIIAVSVAATAGLSKSQTSSGTKMAHGIVSIANKADYIASPATAGSTPCHGTGDFTDISTGGTVTISDLNANILATTNLGSGTVDPNGFCVFPFDAPVTVGKGPYGIQITRRKVVQVDEGSLFSLVTLTLGVSTG
jgi:long-subunit fatty acid transport protein